MRTIGVVTGARSDFGSLVPVLREIQTVPELALQLIVSGMHLAPEFGMTVRAIEEEGFQVSERVEMLVSSDSPEGIAKSMGLGLMGYSQVYARKRPDILLVLGDRFETHSAVLAALPFKIPVAHLHGGELTFGAMDDALRHSITKLSHLHFVATEDYARRVVRMGEEPWRVTVSGAPGLDNLKSVTLLSAMELEAKHGIRPGTPPLLVTFHPVSLEYEDAEHQATELLAALDECGMPLVFTMPNADTHGREVMALISRFVQSHPSAKMVNNLGTQGYFSMMAVAAAMVGNSSSGIVEAASFRLPVVNVGTRQAGRVRPGNVIDVGNNRSEILRGIKTALSEDFKSGLAHLTNPYGDGDAAGRIVERLRSVALDDRLLVKKFWDSGPISA